MTQDKAQAADAVSIDSQEMSDAECREKLIDYLMEIMDARDAMEARGIPKDGFQEMFAQFVSAFDSRLATPAPVMGEELPPTWQSVALSGDHGLVDDSYCLALANQEISKLRACMALRQPGAQTDADRYQRLRILGVAPFDTRQLKNGTVLRFQNLDAFVDGDIALQSSRGEYQADATLRIKATPAAPVIQPSANDGDLDALVREYGNSPVIGPGRTRRVVMQEIYQLAGEIFGAPVNHPAAQEVATLSDAQIAYIWHDLQSNGRSSYLTYARAILAAAPAPLSAPAGSEQK